MKVEYLGDYYKVCLLKNKIYDVISIENGWFEIVDETNDTSFYPPEDFKIIENN